MRVEGIARATADVIDQRVIPMLSCEDVGRAADWIAKAFSFEEAERFEHEGTVDHVTLGLEHGIVFLGSGHDRRREGTIDGLMEPRSEPSTEPLQAAD
jgi:hypothetical protein